MYNIETKNGWSKGSSRQHICQILYSMRYREAPELPIACFDPRYPYCPWLPAKHWLSMSFTAYYRPFRWASGVGYTVDIEYDESSVENTCNNAGTRISNEHYVGYGWVWYVSCR